MSSQSEIRRVMFEAAEAARLVLLRHYGKLKGISKKGEINLVTIADQQAERAILLRVRRAFPGHAILAEESGSSDASGSEYCWVIDPLDGTTNYAHQFPNFSISIGVLRDGKPYAGLVVDVMRDEWFYARRGSGAFCNRKRIRVSDKRRLADSLVVTGFPHDRRRNVDHFLRIVGAMLMRSHGVVRLGSAALDLCSVAAGRLEGFWEEHLNPWDVAAGIVIVEEAGGRCTRFDGHRSRTDDPEILASNGGVHREMLATIREFWEPW